MIRFLTGFMIVVLVGIPLITLASTSPLPNMDNWVGTWVLNVEKSKYGDGKPPVDPTLIRQVLKIRVANSTLDLYVRTEMADGTDVADETHLLDLAGKPHVTEFDGFKPVTETFKQIDLNTIEITLKARPTGLSEENAELTIRVKLTMSADRKTIRETKEYHVSDEDANPAEGSVLVFDKQLSN